MHLQSDKAIASDTTCPSFSKQESGVGRSNPLDSIIEDYSSLEMDSHTTSTKSITMACVHFEEPMFNTRLIYVCTNCLDARLYVDPSN